MYTDSHAHFDEADGVDGHREVLARAAAAGVSRVVAVGGSAALNAGALAAVIDFPAMVRATLGFDRDCAAVAAADAGALQASMSALREAVLAERGRVVAIGETGLDYHYSPDRPAAQRQLFEAQLELALALQLPVVVHSRDADEDTLAVLGAYAASGGRGVLHCFTGGPAFAERLVAIGFLISFSGIVSFRNADPLRAVAAVVPEDRLLLETDTPYLAPVPMRGRRNEPAFLPHVAAAVAAVRGCSAEHLAAVTTANASRLFGDG